MKGVACRDEPTEIYHPALQFPSDLRDILAPFSSLFWFPSHSSRSWHFQLQQAAVFRKKKLRWTHCTLPAQYQVIFSTGVETKTELKGTEYLDIHSCKVIFFFCCKEPSAELIISRRNARVRTSLLHLESLFAESYTTFCTECQKLKSFGEVATSLSEGTSVIVKLSPD